MDDKSSSTMEDRPLNAEELKLCSTVDSFAEAMKVRLLTKAQEGFSGWDSLDASGAAIVIYRMTQDILNKPTSRAVDIANFAMFLWYRRQESDKKKKDAE